MSLQFQEQLIKEFENLLVDWLLNAGLYSYTSWKQLFIQNIYKSDYKAVINKLKPAVYIIWTPLF